MQQRARLFFFQKLVNMAGMLAAAAAPSAIAYLLRKKDHGLETVPCDYLFHPNTSSAQNLHGTLPGQLYFVDAAPFDKGVVINKTSEFCVTGGGAFCYEVCSYSAYCCCILHVQFVTMIAIQKITNVDHFAAWQHRTPFATPLSV